MAVQLFEKLMFKVGNSDKTPIKTPEFDAREFSSIGRSILLFASLEKQKKLYFVSRCLYSLYVVKHGDFWPFLA